ncbi:CHAP domain-containing protein [Salipiger sp. H15]|uniref:CHAP domain-containing protein n=1 Tax=Alloyangia sp. H15 TaxID=3029062 RepID=A0AAU8AKK8_9RHOB
MTAACSRPVPEMQTLSDLGLDEGRQELALREAEALQSRGQRVWCVPFARNLSGIDIRGNAETWWGQAKDLYARGKEPEIGSVMAFSKTRAMPMGHVAVVSDVVSPREVLVDHANWRRNEISLKMAVVDVSASNDWSEVRVESNPGTFGSTYPVNGFIYPTRLR